MRVPPSRPDNLAHDGASVRIWHDTKGKGKQLAALRGKTFAQAVDEAVHEALQREYDRLEAEGRHP